MNIEFPVNFPTEDEMLGILHKTIEKSWENNIDNDTIEKWLSNFSGELYNIKDERKIGLWLLCNYTYYSPKEVKYLCRMLFKYFMHNIIVKEELHSDEEITEVINKICFSSIGLASESGGMLLYHFRQEANISIDRFYYPTAIESSDDSILVFIDDVTLSGGTAARFFHKNLKEISRKHLYYLTLIASEEAIEKLSKLGIEVIYCYLLDDRDKCFSENSMIFNMFPSLKDVAKALVEFYGKSIEPDIPLGYKNGEYCFGFYYNTPNNTLPIFWSEKNDWIPILERKEKLQNARQIDYKSSRYI